jgi:hypothetical protein
MDAEKAIVALEIEKTAHAATKTKLDELRARRLDLRWLAGMVISFWMLTGGLFALLSYCILTATDINWAKTGGVLALCLLWVTFAAVSTRLLSDRCK